MGKLSFLAGAAVGYVLGAKAGRQRYEQIKASANKVWSSDPVQARVGDVTNAAKNKAAPFVADKLGDAAKAASRAMRDRTHPSASGTYAGSATGTSAGSTTGAAPGTTGAAPGTTTGAASRPNGQRLG